MAQPSGRTARSWLIRLLNGTLSVSVVSVWLVDLDSVRGDGEMGAVEGAACEHECRLCS